MIDRTKPLVEQDAADLRALLDALHSNRARYESANRIVEARSCELEISEATRALAIINRRATEAMDARDVKQHQVDAVLAVLRHHGEAEAHEVVTRMWTAMLLEQAQREADIIEAYTAGARYITDHGVVSIIDVPKEAAEYARNKAGG